MLLHKDIPLWRQTIFLNGGEVQPLHVWEWIKTVNKGHKHRGTKERIFFHRLLFPSFIYQSWYSRETNEILLQSFWFYWMLECRLNKDIDLWHTVISPSVQIWLSPHCFTGNSNESLTLPRNLTSFFSSITLTGREKKDFMWGGKLKRVMQKSVLVKYSPQYQWVRSLRSMWDVS